MKEHCFTFYRIEIEILQLGEVPEYSRIETARIYIPTNGKEHNKILSKLGLVYRKSHNQNYVMFDLLTVNPILNKFELLYGSGCKHIILIMCLNRLFL